MITVILVIHLMIALALVGVVLLQKSEGGALGIGGSGGGMGGFMTGRGTSNLLTRTTAILAASFIVTSLALAKLAELDRPDQSILDGPESTTEQLPVEPDLPTGPTAPIAE